MPESVLEQLEAWTYEHKSHAVSITHDDGYGAHAGWEVELSGRGRKTVTAYEGWCPAADKPLCTSACSEEDDDDWPGLAATIAAALKLAGREGL